jgi:hypothetical protein
MFVTLHGTATDPVFPLDLAFEWDPQKSNLTRITAQRVHFKLAGT